MVSAIISCIDAILAALDEYPVFYDKSRLIFGLWNLKTFVLCARKLPNDTSLGSFLSRIKDTIRKWVEEIHLHCCSESDLYLKWTDETRFRFMLHDDGGQSFFIMLYKILDELQSLEEEVDKWYVTLLDHSQDSTSLINTAEQVLEIILHIVDCHMGIFEDIIWKYFGEAMEALTEQLEFLSWLIWVATQTSVEPTQDFLAHSETVALHAASLFLSFRERQRNDFDEESGREMQFDEESGREMQLKISALVQKIKPIDPQVYESYTQVLSGSEVLRRLLPSTQDMDDDDDADDDDYADDDDVDDDDADDDVTYARKVILNTLISNLWEILQLDTCVVFMKDQLKELYGGLRSLRNILEHPPTKFDSKIEEEIGAVLCDAGVFIWPFYQTNPEVGLGLGLQDLLQTIKNVLAEVGQQDPQLPKFDFPGTNELEIKEDVLNTFCGKKEEIEVKEATSTSNQMPSQRTRSAVNEVVGFDNEARSIMERLRRGSRSLRMIAIVGMPGSGKTTLATKTFNDPSVMHHFQVRVWCPISQTLNRGKVLLDLLNQIDPKSRSEKSEEDLSVELRQSLKGRRYLIFLDDVWEIEAWNRLTMDGLLFPDDAVGSRIILTSRHHDAAPPHMLDQEPHFLRQLKEKESLELLQKKLLPQNGWPLEFHDILVQIAEISKGLPLTIVIVAGLLATTEPEGWKEILDDLSLGLGSVRERCKNTLELSYKTLPHDLRSCLLYFGVFEEDEEISVRKLFRLWIAEGFVQKTHEVKSLEDAAEDYLKDLIGRSLIMVAKQRSYGGVKTCCVHDLIHDFCLEKVKNEHFFHFLKGRDELLAFSEPCNLRRLSIHSEVEHFKQSQLFCPGVHSLLFNCSPIAWNSFPGTQQLVNISFVIHAFKFLKVLDLQQLYLATGFPDEIVLLVQLTFLAIAGNIEHIPSSVTRLSNLETLILDTMARPLLPGGLWNLHKLQYLFLRVSTYPVAGGGILGIENLDSSPTLYDLDRFSGAAIPSHSMGRLLKKFPNIRRLKCRLLQSADEENEEEDTIVVVDFQSQLESLHILYDHRSSNIFEFSFPETLKKLSLSSLRLSLRNISMIGKLPTLEVLKFYSVKFEGNRWEMKEGEFLELRFLELSYIDDLKWTACDDQFGCLQKLVLKRIDCCEEIPSCLESISTLEMIDVSCCCSSVIEMVRQIEEQQVMFGNSSLKINIVG